MPDIIITPSTGKLEFVDLSAQVTRRHSFTLDANNGLNLDSPLSAAAISAPLNVINVTVDNSNVNYPFVLAQSGETGAKNLLMDGAGGTYNPFTNTATIDISGNAATATNSTQLNGQAASYYTNIPARLGYTPVNQAGDTITGNVVINGNFTVTGATTLFSASSVYISSSQLVVDDNIITLNAFSPYLRYTGIEMIDSGSATTSSILWDSQNDYFFLTGSGINGKIITGPDQQGNLTSTKIPKATGTNILGDSIITDNGSSISIGGSITATNLSGTNTGDQTVGDATLTVAAGTGISLSASPSFTANATTNKTITVTNSGVTSAIAGTGISVDTGTGAVTITNSSPNATHTGDVTGATSLTIAANAVTTAKIADANVTNAKLANSSVTIGSTAVSLGATVTTFAGLTSVTSTNFVGALTGTATTASYANALNPANSYSAASVTTTGKLEAGGNVIAGGQFSGAGTGLTGTAASLNIGGTAGSETLGTVTGRGGSTGTQILVATAAGQAMFVGRQAGSGYSYGSAGIFTAQSDNPNGTQNAFFQGYISSSATVASGNLTFSIRADGQIYTTMNTATGIANNSFSVGQNVVGSIHIANGGGTSGNNRQAAITFQGDSVNTAQAGIYVSNNTSTGTAMGFATTDNYTTGPQLFMTATNTGVVNFSRARPTYAGNALVDVAGGQTIAGITYFSNGESMNVYGIRGRFTNEYLHLYNKVGVGHPGGWGQGEGSTPNQGLSTYGGIAISYGTNAASVFYGNVGLGATSTTAKLHIKGGNEHIEGAVSGSTIIDSGLYAMQVGPAQTRATAAGTYYPGIAFNHLLNFSSTTYNGAPQAWIGTRLQDSAGSERDYLVFATKPGTGVTGTGNDIPIERMCIDYSGNVGIGNTAPSYKLHVAGDIYANGGWLRVSGTSGLYFETYAGGFYMSDGTWIRTYNSKNIWSGTGLIGSDGGLSVGYGGTSPTSLGAIISGSVGIGTSSPTAKVESYYSSNAITFNYLATNLNNSSPIPVYGFDVTNGVGESRSIKAGIGYERHLTNGRGTLHFYNASTNDTQSLVGTRLSSGDIKMSLDNSGNLGIGTTIPSVKLHVVGSSILANNTSINPDSYIGQVVAGNIADGSGWGVSGAIGGNGSANGRSWAIGNSGTVLYMGFQNGSSTTSMQTFLQVSGSRDVTLVPTSGNVGINTTNFSYTINDNSRLVGSNTNNKLFVNGSIQLLNDNDAIVIGRGTATFLSDEELGFGWGGGWYMTDSTYLRVRNNKVLYNNGEIWGTIFKDSNNTSYYLDPASTSVLYSIAAGVAGNSSANIPALKVTSAGTATTQAAIAIQQQTSEGDTIIFCDFDQYVEWNLVHENNSNQLIVHGGSSTGNLGSNTFYSPNGTAKTGYIKHVFDMTDGNAYHGGNVGVGLNNPSSRLHIYENANRVSYLAQNNVHTARFEAYGTATAIDTTASNGIYFRMSGADVVKFAVDGNVGIGTTVPGRKLDVEGIVRTRGASGTGGFEISAASTGTAKWRIEWDSASDSLDFNWVG